MRSLAVVAVLACSACAYKPTVYSPSASNVQVMQNTPAISKMSLPPFNAAADLRDSIMCRAAGPISPPNERNYAEYIYAAYQSELAIAGLLSDTAPAIQGEVKTVDFSSAGNAAWKFTVSFRNASGQTAVVDSSYSFDSAFVADKACQRVAQNLSPAVERLIRDTVQDPSFQALFR